MYDLKAQGRADSKILDPKRSLEKSPDRLVSQILDLKAQCRVDSKILDQTRT